MAERRPTQDAINLSVIVEDYDDANYDAKLDTEDDDDDCKTVTLRRRNGENGCTVTVSEEDYKFLDLVDEPFLTGKSSRRKVEIGSEKMISNVDLLLAATLVSDAIEGRTADIKTEQKYVRSYNLYNSRPLAWLLYATIILNQLVVLFEKPAPDNMELPFWATMLVEVVCLVYFVIRTMHQKHWRRNIIFFRDLKNLFLIFLITATILDMFQFLIFEQVGIPGNMRNIRYSRALRPMFLVNFSDGRQIRRAWRNIRRTIKEVIHVLLLFYFIVLVFALIAYLMFSKRTDITYPDGKPYFKDYMDCVWDLYVLVTTSNNPDVMMPAYETNRFYSLFFFVYILVCFYMLLNVFLAVAYHSYNANMKEEIKKSSRDKRKKLGQAFDVIKINVNGEDMVTYSIWKRLMRLANPGLSKNQIDLLMLILDTKRSGCISRKEFMNVADLLNVPVSEVADRLTCLDAVFPDCYTSAASEYVKSLVDSIYFKILFDVVVVLHIFLIAFFVEGIQVAFCVIFMAEIFLKIYTFGFRKYVKMAINWLDILVTLSSLIDVLFSGVIKDPVVLTNIEAFQIIRVFRILRLLVHIQRFRIITDTLVNISLSILMYAGIVFIVFYVFAVVGMELFQYKIRFFENVTSNVTNNVTNMTYNVANSVANTSRLYCGAPELKDSAFYESQYCSLNFNDFSSSVMVLSALLFENNWHIVTEGFVLVTNRYARIYFAVFFLTAAVVIMNIITAFVVDMFMYEYTLQMEGRTDSPVERKIKDLGLGIDAETGTEISNPLTDEELQNMVRNGTINLEDTLPPVHPMSDRGSTLAARRRAETRFERFSHHVLNRRSVQAPTLNRFDGIRFHIKKTGWTKIEVLLQQLYESQTDLAKETTENGPMDEISRKRSFQV